MITKKQFEDSYRKFPPCKCELFYMRYLSISSLSQNIWAALLISLGLMLPFIFATVAEILGWPPACTYVPSFMYAGLLAIIGVYSSVIWYKRQCRIRNICKDLNITRMQYENLVDKYYYKNYYPDIKDYINSILPK
jgi:hypothetical protein